MARTHTRRNYFVDKRFQTKVMIKFCAMMLLTSLALGVLFMLFLQDSTTVAFENSRVVVKGTSDFIFPVMVQTLVMVIVASTISLVIFTLIETHRIAGPLYRIKKEIKLLTQGDLTVAFRIRAKDELKELALALANLAKSFKRKHNALESSLAELKTAVQAGDQKATAAKIDGLEEILKSYKS